MTEAHLLSLRRCCRAGVYSGDTGCVEYPPSRPSASPCWTGEVVGEVKFKPRRDLAVARHEAAHCVIGHATGMLVKHVTIDGQPHASLQHSGASRASIIAMNLAGDIAIAEARRGSDGPFPRQNRDRVLRFANVVRDFNFGGCDYCEALLQIASMVGINAPDLAFIQAYEDIEGATIRAVRAHWRAIETLSGALMVDGVIERKNIIRIIEANGTAFGSWSDRFDHFETRK